MTYRAAEPLPGVPRRLLEPGAREAAKRITDERLTKVMHHWQGDRGLLIIGPTGIGKSLTLAQAARRLAAERMKVFEQPKLSWFRSDELSRAGRESVALAKRAPVAVLDELGWERKTDTLIEVIGARYDASRVTVATSGQTLDGFLKRYGDAILRRILEVGGGELVDMWEPLRGQVSLELEGKVP